jgi:hypothetical protein
MAVLVEAYALVAHDKATLAEAYAALVEEKAALAQDSAERIALLTAQCAMRESSPPSRAPEPPCPPRGGYHWATDTMYGHHVVACPTRPLRTVDRYARTVDRYARTVDRYAESCSTAQALPPSQCTRTSARCCSRVRSRTARVPRAMRAPQVSNG